MLNQHSKLSKQMFGCGGPIQNSEKNQGANSNDDVSCQPSDNQNVLLPTSPASIPSFG
jgi:hypothetical protein